MYKKKIALLTLSVASQFAAASDAPTLARENMMETSPLKGMERCYGIAKTHRNDCGTSRHGCSGEATTDGSPNEWLAVPEGLCNKIVGGFLKSNKSSS